jgi:hypothetical protein
LENGSPNSKKVFLVLGCPRSGTSTIARALPVFGANLCGQLVAPGPANKRGFWENEEASRINAGLMHLAGLKDFAPGSINLERLTRESTYDEFLSRAETELSRCLQVSNNIGLKNPHCCRFLPFWQDAIHRTGGHARHIIAVRNPRCVVHSLRAFMQVRRLLGYALWLEYTMRAVEDTLGKPRVIVSYEAMLKDPNLQVRRIAREFGLDSQINQKELKFYADSYITRDLEHTHYDHSKLMQHCPELPLVTDVYELLLRRAADEMDNESFVKRWNPLYARYCMELPQFYRANPWMMNPLKRHEPWAVYAWYKARHIGVKESVGTWMKNRIQNWTAPRNGVGIKSNQDFVHYSNVGK